MDKLLQDRGDGVKTMPVSRCAGRQGLHPEDDREGRRFKERERERERERVLCPEYRKDMVKGSLVTHHQNQHGMAKRGLGPEGDKAEGGDNPRTYRMAFPTKEGPRPCPAERCSGQA